MRSRARPPLILIAGVLLVHLFVGHEVQRISEGWSDQGTMQARMQVAFVREMKIEPVAAAPVTVAPAVKPKLKPKPAAAGAVPASAPEPKASEPAPAAPPPAVAEPVVAELPAEPASAASAVSAASPASAATLVEAEPGPEWPLSTRLSYTLEGNYRGPVSGQAQVEWLRQGRRYQINLDVSVGPSFAPLFSRRMSSQGVLGAQGIRPERYDEETKLILSDRRLATILFLGENIKLASGAYTPALQGVQDSASQFVQLTWLFLTGREPLRPGHVIEQPLVLPRRQYAWRYEVTGEETVDTPMGPLAAWHLRPGRDALSASSSGDLTAEAWLAPALQYLPVRIRIRQDADTWIDLTLKAAPLQAAPESTDTPRRPP